jgi:HEAT repeat protein
VRGRGRLAALSVGTADPPKVPPPPPPTEKIDLDLIPDPDLEWLKRAKVPTDNDGLIGFLRSCQGKELPPAEIDGLVGKLLSDSKDEQADAARKLAEAGTIAVPALRKHRTGPDADAARRVRDCLEKIEEAGDNPLARPAMRRLLVRRPAGTAEALLGFLPVASDPAAEEDIYYGLDQLAEKDPKTLDPLAKALKDPQPARRAVAACILGRRGTSEQKQTVRELLNDSDSTVRLRAAQGLLAGRDKGGMPTLIELLDDSSVEVRWQAEELLRWTAIDTAPAPMGSEPEAKRGTRCRGAWRQWWKENGEKLDLDEVEKEPRRSLLLLGYNRAEGRVWIFGSDGETRHEWQTKKGLEDAQYVPGGTVLTLHEQPIREKPLLAERDRAGKVLWQYEDLWDPKYCQRLSNGHVFVAEYQDQAQPYLRYRILTPAGKVLATQPPRLSAYTTSCALRLTADGRIASGAYDPSRTYPRIGYFAVFDPRIDTWANIDVISASFDLGRKCYLEETSDHGYLVSGIHNRSPRADIIEIDELGEQVWTYILPDSTHAVRLRGGTTLACDRDRVVELSRDRRMVGEIPITAAPHVARPCLSLVRFGFDRFPADFDLEMAIDYRVASLKRKDSRARLFALKRLEAFGPTATSMLPKLNALEDDPDPAIRKALRQARLAMGIEEIPRLLKESKHVDPVRRSNALTQIRLYYTSPEVIEAQLTGLRDENAKVRTAAAYGLGGTQGPNPQGRISIWESQGRHGWSAEKIVPALIKSLASDNDPDVRRGAMYALGDLRGKSKVAVPLLLTIVKDKQEPDVNRAWALRTLGQIGDDSPEVLAALYAALADPTVPRFRRDAAWALSFLRPANEETIRQLRAAYQRDDIKDAEMALQGKEMCLSALWWLKATDPAAIEFLMGIVKDDSVSEAHRSVAAGHLLRLGKPGAEVVPFVEKWIKDGKLSPADELSRAFKRYRQEMSGP